MHFLNMAFVWNDDESDIENLRNYVGFIIQTIENQNPTMDRVLADLQRLFERLQDTR